LPPFKDHISPIQYQYEVIEVLGDGYTYNLKAVDHNGRAKSRHFNMLKTVHRS
jgi:hypothetical protein